MNDDEELTERRHEARAFGVAVDDLVLCVVLHVAPMSPATSSNFDLMWSALDFVMLWRAAKQADS